jgi:hypothetical protein
MSLAVAFLASAFLASAQEGPPMPKKVPPELIKEVPDKDLPGPLVPKDEKGKGKDPAAKAEESPKEIIERLHKNMEKANVHLKDKSDPTELTRKIQGDIIDDLDKLIKQQKDNESC